MKHRFGSIFIVFVIAVSLLYLQNKVYVGSQYYFAEAVPVKQGEEVKYPFVSKEGGYFLLKDIAGKAFEPTALQIEQFKYFAERGSDGKPFLIDTENITVNGMMIEYKFQNSSQVNLRRLKKFEKRLLEFSFSEPNSERDLLFVPLGIDLRGGVEFICSLYDDDQNRVEAEQQTVDILRTRLETRGLSEPQVSRLTNGDIQVVIPGGGKAEAARTRKVLETTGKLEFREVLEVFGIEDEEAFSSHEPGEQIIINKKGKPAFKPGGGAGFDTLGEKLYPLKAPRGQTPLAFYRLGPAKITGQHVEDGFTTANDDGTPAVGIKLNATGGSISYEWTTDVKKRGPLGESTGGSGRFAICLDGVVFSAPRVQEPTGVHSRITGQFTTEEVNNLILVLDTGALTVTPEVLSERVIGATLGKETISKGLVAMVTSLAIILGFIVMYYRRLGVVAMVSLATTLALVWTAVSVFSITMTLPGLAGLVLTIGMAVDANILIFERIREEISEDVDLRTSLDAGYARAFLTIFDANVTTFLTAFVLAWIGTGAIKGFGNTLMIGIVTSMFGAIYIGRIITDFLYHKIDSTKVNDSLSKLPLEQPYVSWRMPAAILSTLVIIVGMYTFIAGGSKHFAIDFTGGNMVQATLVEPKSLEEIQDTLEKAYKSDPEKYNLLGEDLQILPYFSDFEESGEKSRQYVFKGRDDQAIIINKNMAGQQEALWKVSEKKNTKLNEGVPLTDPAIRELNKEIAKLKLELQPFKDQLAERIEVFKSQLASALAGMIIAEHSELVAISFDEQRMSITLTMLSVADDTQKAQVNDGMLKRNDLTDVSISTDDVRMTFNAKYVRDIDVDPAIGDKQVTAMKEQDALWARMYDQLDAATPVSDRYAHATLLRNYYDTCVDRAASSGLQVAAAYPATDHFSPQVASQMKNKAYLALGFSMLAILFYIAMRFEFRYGVGAIMALTHDVIATVGILAMLGVRIDLTVVAALLTIVGYSLNDTIVVFDRIRENIKKYGKAMIDTIDKAIAQTMSRTILTSLTTIFVITILLIWGGEGVRSFSVTMLVGLILGTYSSVFVASPSLLLFKDPEPEDETDEVVPGT